MHTGNNMSDLNPFSIEAIDLGDLFSEIDLSWTLPEFDPIDLGDLFEPFDLGELFSDFDLISIDELFPPDPEMNKWLDDLTNGCGIGNLSFDFPDWGDDEKFATLKTLDR